jgi:hypothetical protein
MYPYCATTCVDDQLAPVLLIKLPHRCCLWLRLVPVLPVQRNPADFPRDVWVQLLDCCAQSPKCRTLLNQLYEQLKQQLSLAGQQLQQLDLDIQDGGRSSMVEVQLQCAQLRQHTAWVAVTMRHFDAAIEVVRDALLGSGSWSRPA